MGELFSVVHPKRIQNQSNLDSKGEPHLHIDQHQTGGNCEGFLYPRVEVEPH